MWLENYILSYTNTKEYYTQRLLGITEFVVDIDTTDTVDCMVYGIKKLHIEFSILEDAICKSSDILHTTKDVREAFYKNYSINKCVMDVDLLFLTHREHTFLNWYKFDVEITIRVISTDLIEQTNIREVYYSNIFFSLKLAVSGKLDCSNYYFVPFKYPAININSIKVWESFKIDSKNVLIQYPLNSTKLDELVELYSSKLNILFDIDDSISLEQIYTLLHDKEKRGYKSLYYTGSVTESKVLFDEEVNVISKWLCKCESLFDDITALNAE